MMRALYIASIVVCLYALAHFGVEAMSAAHPDGLPLLTIHQQPYP